MARILIVEDSPTQAEEMRLLLGEAGWEIELARDGFAGLRALKAAPPDLIVTDLKMPGMDGLALVEAVRLDYPYVPVILVTSFGSEEIAARALRVGATSYVPKRNLLIDLVPTVAEILDVTVEASVRRRVLEGLTRAETHFTLESDSTLVSPLVRHIEDCLSMIGFGDPAVQLRVAVALSEALHNAIERGNLEIASDVRRNQVSAYQDLMDRRRQERPYRDRQVHVAAKLSPSEASFLVRDEGPGFSAGAVAVGDEFAGIAGTRGRGLFLIRTFMDDVKHNKAGNEIWMTRRGASDAS